MFSGGDDGPRGAPGPSLPSPLRQVLPGALPVLNHDGGNSGGNESKPCPMRIDPRFSAVPLSSTAPQRSISGQRFTLDGSGDARGAGRTAASAPLGTLDALLAVQGEGDPAERRRRSLKRGHDLLDSLDKLKAALLSGRVGQMQLRTLPRRSGHRADRAAIRVRRDRRPYRTPSPGRNGANLPGFERGRGRGKLICPEIKLRPAAPTSVLMLRNIRTGRVRQIGPEPLRSPGFPMLRRESARTFN